MTKRSALPTVSLFAPLVLLAGCLEREETVTIHENGAVSIVHRWRGDAGDLDGGAARLPDPAVWRIERRTQENENGDEEDVLTAWADFRSAADVPTRFGLAEDPLAGAAFTFHTDLEIHREGDSTRYVFKRRYEPRIWSHYRYFWRQAFPKDVEDLIHDEDLWRRPVEDRRKVVHAVVDYERMKVQHWAEKALAEVAPDDPRLLDAQLAVRRAIADLLGRELATEAAERVVVAPTREIDEWTVRLLRELDKTIQTRAAEVLGLDAAAIQTLMSTIRMHRHDFEVSHDLEDESFVVRVKMPGRVTGHNGDRTEAGHVIWRFDCEGLRDRAQVLVAVSVVGGR